MLLDIERGETSKENTKGMRIYEKGQQYRLKTFLKKLPLCKMKD